MKYLFLVPGYITSQKCTSEGDTYFEIAKAACAKGYQFVYIPIPNNNFGDIGNTTLEMCLDHVVLRYNVLCTELNISTDDTVLLAGHSMGGLLVARAVTDAVIGRLVRLPDVVRILNPAFSIGAAWYLRSLVTLLSFMPETLFATLSISARVCGKNTLYPGSPDLSTACKQLLATSLASHTGTLLFNNKPWKLTPDTSMKERITIIACAGDAIVQMSGITTYCKNNTVPLVLLSLEYHEYFPIVLLDALLL